MPPPATSSYPELPVCKAIKDQELEIFLKTKYTLMKGPLSLHCTPSRNKRVALETAAMLLLVNIPERLVNQFLAIDTANSETLPLINLFTQSRISQVVLVQDYQA